MLQHTILIGRIYDEHPGAARILTDRIWPRGVSKEKARLDFWAKDLAPSTELRKWFHSGAGSWDEFAQRYRAELEHLLASEPSAPKARQALDRIAELLQESDVALLTAVKTAEEHPQSHPMVLREWLLEQLQP